MGKGINGGYLVETVSANQITLTSMTGEAINLPAAVSQYIRIAKTRTSGILGLYKVTAVSGDKKEFTVSKVDQPGWTAFPTDYRFYFNTYIEPITDLKNWQLGPYLICPQNETTDKIEIDFFIFEEPDLHARLLSRIVMENIVVDHEVITRNFPEGKGEIEMLCVYEIASGLNDRYQGNNNEQIFGHQKSFLQLKC